MRARGARALERGWRGGGISNPRLLFPSSVIPGGASPSAGRAPNRIRSARRFTTRWHRPTHQIPREARTPDREGAHDHTLEGAHTPEGGSHVHALARGAGLALARSLQVGPHAHTRGGLARRRGARATAHRHMGARMRSMCTCRPARARGGRGARAISRGSGPCRCAPPLEGGGAVRGEVRPFRRPAALLPRCMPRARLSFRAAVHAAHAQAGRQPASQGTIVT